MGRVAALDFGVKRIGVALSDAMRLIASPLEKILAKKTTKETIEHILLELSSHDVETIIVGYPLHLNGKVGLLADEVKHFFALLQEAASCNVVLWDERLTSLQAEKAMKEGGLSRKKRASFVDSLAATILLQSYLDAYPLLPQSSNA